MKKLTAIILVLLLCGSLLPAALAAEPALSVATASARPGGSVEVQVSFSGNPGLGGYQGRVSYDAGALELIGGSGSSAFPDLNFSLNAGTGLFLAYTGSAGADGDGVLFTLRFRVREEAAEGLSAVSLTELLFIDKSLQEYAVTLTGGGVEVSATAPTAGPAIATSAPRATAAAVPGASAATAAPAPATQAPAAAEGTASAPADGTPGPGAQAGSPSPAADAAPTAESGPDADPGARPEMTALPGGTVLAAPDATDAPDVPGAERNPRPTEYRAPGSVDGAAADLDVVTASPAAAGPDGQDGVRPGAWVWIAALLAALLVAAVLVLLRSRRRDRDGAGR